MLLLGTEKDAASFEIDGGKRSLRMGRAYSAPARAGRQYATLSADARGPAAAHAPGYFLSLSISA